MLSSIQTILPALYWVVYFGVFLEWRVVRLRGRGPARHRWLRLFETLSIFVAILGCLVAQLNQSPPEIRLRGGSSQGRHSGLSENHGNDERPRGPPSVRVRQRRIEVVDNLEDLREAIDERRPIMVLESGQEWRPMHLEELAHLFYRMESRRSDVLTQDENGEAVRLSDILPKWNQNCQLASILARNEDGSLYWEAIPPNNGRLLYVNQDFPPIEMELEQIRRFVEFDEIVRNYAFEVTDDNGVTRTSIEGLNALNAKFDIYVRLNDGQVRRLDWLLLEIHYHDHPHVWMYDNWWLATPEVLRHLAEDDVKSLVYVEGDPPAKVAEYWSRGAPIEPLMIPMPGYRFGSRANEGSDQQPAAPLSSAPIPASGQRKEQSSVRPKDGRTTQNSRRTEPTSRDPRSVSKPSGVSRKLSEEDPTSRRGT